jgi:hypothetical protein
MSPMAVSNNFLVAPAAYDAAVRYNPRERWLLRKSRFLQSSRIGASLPIT